MDQQKVGQLLRALRRERGMKQREVAAALGVSPKTVSKWECGAGCPDLSLLPGLARFFAIDAERLLTGRPPEEGTGRNGMRNIRFYRCPTCGNVLTSMSEAEVSCCGRKLAAMEPQKADGEHMLAVEQVEGERFITCGHPMEKEHFISFAALSTGERLTLIPTWPEWELQLRLPGRGHGKLYFCCVEHGLFYQLV